jgi:hypothetical protein
MSRRACTGRSGGPLRWASRLSGLKRASLRRSSGTSGPVQPAVRGEPVRPGRGPLIQRAAPGARGHGPRLRGPSPWSPLLRVRRPTRGGLFDDASSGLVLLHDHVAVVFLHDAINVRTDIRRQHGEAPGVGGTASYSAPVRATRAVHLSSPHSQKKRCFSVGGAARRSGHARMVSLKARRIVSASVTRRRRNLMAAPYPGDTTGVG